MPSKNPLDTTDISLDQIPSPKRAKKAEEFLKDLLPLMDSYHNHKENLAHASIAVMGGLAGAILIRDSWPPALKIYSFFCPQLVASIVFIILWGLIHVYMRWQLRNRRSAAIMFNVAIRKLAEWVEKGPTRDDLNTATRQNLQCHNMKWFILDHLWIVRRGVLLAENAKIYPDWLMVLFERERNKIRIPSEYFLTIASYIFLALILVRTWFFGGK
jgi:hypothetical protein